MPIYILLSYVLSPEIFRAARPDRGLRDAVILVALLNDVPQAVALPTAEFAQHPRNRTAARVKMQTLSDACGAHRRAEIALYPADNAKDVAR